MTTLEFDVVIGLKAASVIAFGDVNLFFAVVVMRNLYIDLSISIAAVCIPVTASNVDVSVMLFN